MFRGIEYGGNKNFKPIKITNMKSNCPGFYNKIYSDIYIITGISLFSKKKISDETKILNIMKEMNKEKKVN